jgi:hypothetical protein
VRRQAVGLFEDFRSLAVAEPGGVANASGQKIGRRVVEDLPPNREGTVESAP